MGVTPRPWHDASAASSGCPGLRRLFCFSPGMYPRPFGPSAPPTPAACTAWGAS